MYAEPDDDCQWETDDFYAGLDPHDDGDLFSTDTEDDD